MIKKYREFIFEDDDSGSIDNDPTFKSRFEKFKDYLSKKSAGQSSSTSAPEPASSSSASTPSVTSFGNVDQMIGVVVKYLNKHGITNPIVQRAILATIGKESGFTATKEASYKTTSPARIKQIFGTRFSGLSDEEINQIKQDDSQFWEKVYGGEWGKRVEIRASMGVLRSVYQWKK